MGAGAGVVAGSDPLSLNKHVAVLRLRIRCKKSAPCAQPKDQHFIKKS